MKLAFRRRTWPTSFAASPSAPVIARVGTTAAHYDPLRRSFWAGPAGGAPGVAVMPARYGAFLARRRKLTAADAVVHPLAGPFSKDKGRFFLVPVHKLFSGNECLAGEDFQLSYQEFHRSEKLRRIQAAQQKVGVGNRGLSSTLAVAGRPRIGPRADRADLE